MKDREQKIVSKWIAIGVAIGAALGTASERIDKKDPEDDANN